MTWKKLECVERIEGHWKVAYLIEGDRCYMDEFMDDLKKNYPSAFKNLIIILRRLAQSGDVRNTEGLKRVGEGLGIWQVNSRKPPLPRLYGFTWKGWHIITHGTSKQKKPRKEYERAKRYKALWAEENP